MATQNSLRAVIGTSVQDISSMQPATLDQLASAVLAKRQLDRAIVEIAHSCREAGASYADIARVLGITRQTAWERFREEPDAG